MQIKLRKAKAMNNEMPDNVWVDHSVMVCWPDGEQPKNADITSYVRTDKAVPEGFVMVPIEPTRDMIDAFMGGESGSYIVDSYKAMLSAAPQPPTKGGI